MKRQGGYQADNSLGHGLGDDSQVGVGHRAHFGQTEATPCQRFQHTLVAHGIQHAWLEPLRMASDVRSTPP